jgi:DNA-binding transcriptional regulator PaaX
MVLFDLPQARANARARLRRFLKASRFGYLQKSVWISPDPLNDITRELSASSKDVESIITLEARPGAGETDADIVAGAWKFKYINQLYESCMKVLQDLPQTESTDAKSFGRLHRWAQLERATWQAAVSADPLLPDKLQPADYLGKQAWRERVRVLAKAAQMLADL